MKLECLRAVASYHERKPYNEWKCPLALSAASPRARVAVELNQNFKCGVFRISVDETRTARHVRIHLYEVYEGRVCEDEEAMMDWWLLRRETCLPIMFQAYRPDIAVWSPGAVFKCCIEVSAMLPIVQTMRISESTSSLSWVDKCTRLESLYAAECLYPIKFSGFRNSACLKQVDVSRSKVDSFEGISGCVNLEVLDVSNCTAGTDDYSPIGRCTVLKKLEIDGCETIRDFSWIGQLKALTYLSMNDVELGDMSWIGSCASLQKLLMVGSSFDDHATNISGFRNLVCLKSVSIRNRDVHSFDGISGCVNLEELDASSCTAGTDDFSPIGRCSRLQRLNIDDCGTKDFSWIGQLKELTDLSMNYVELGDMDWIAGCASLENLLMMRDLYDDHPTSLSGFRDLVCLKSVSMNHRHVHSFEGISGCVNLEVLHMSNCTGTGDYSPIGCCSRLQRLYMNKCDAITDFSWIGKLKALPWLSMGYLKVGDIGWIAGCASLQRLFMAGSRCEDYHPIMALKKLRWLEFYGTGVSDMEWTRSMDSLEEVYVGDSISRIGVIRSQYPDAKTWGDALQAYGRLKMEQQ